MPIKDDHNIVYNKYGKPISVYSVALELGHAPTSDDITELGRIAVYDGKIYVLSDVSGIPASATWTEIADATPDGLDGQVKIGATGSDADWANITSTGGTLVITNGANTINMEVSGATTSSFPTDAGTATPLLGATQIGGDGANISTSAIGNAIEISLTSDPTVTGDLDVGGSITAGDTLEMSAGTCTITADDNAADVIYLHSDGGVLDTIRLHADQGTDVASIGLISDAGGITIDAGLASADAINIDASNAAGGIDIDYGTGGMTVDGANGAFTVQTGTGAINLGADAAAKVITIGNTTAASSVVVDCGTGGASIGASATAHTTTVGSTTTTSATVVQSGTGDVSITSTDAITADAVGVLELNSTGGAIGIGNDADAQAINIGTGAAVRTITIGNVTGATGLVLNSGTGSIALASTGTGDITIDSDDTLLLDADGVLELNSSGAAINIGNDADAQAVNICTGAAARDLTLGSTNTTSSTTINAGTGGIDLDASGNVTMTPDTATFAGAAVTINANVGVGTFTGLVTAAGAQQVFTITNSVCTATSAIMVTVSNVGTNDAQMTMTRVKPAAGSFTVTCENMGAAALNGDVIITFWIIQ